jgi:hypothetical protein
MSVRTTGWIVVAAITAVIFGAILSRAVESGVHVEKVTLATNTPALRISPQRRVRIQRRYWLMETAARKR